MKGFPAGHDQELFFGLAVEDPKGPDNHYIKNFQSANLNVITNVSAFLAEHDISQETVVEQEEPVAAPARYGELAIGPLDSYLLDWIADGAEPTVTVVYAERPPEEAMELDGDDFIPGAYEVVPLMRRRRGDEGGVHISTSFARSRHRRPEVNRVEAGHVAASPPAEFLELQDVAVA